MSTSVLCEDEQEGMDTGSTHQEGGPATPMEDSSSQEVTNTSATSEGDVEATPIEGGDNIPYDVT